MEVTVKKAKRPLGSMPRGVIERKAGAKVYVRWADGAAGWYPESAVVPLTDERVPAWLRGDDE